MTSFCYVTVVLVLKVCTPLHLQSDERVIQCHEVRFIANVQTQQGRSRMPGLGFPFQ